MEKIPKVFISYSWSNPEHEERVLNLAERLTNHGVHIVLDKWDLTEGQDKYHFMEQMVTDSQVDKVLLICDKIYAEKANARIGGVGDETTIISSELYGKMKQEKFIPVIFEKDEEGKNYCPTYAKSRIYVDLSTEDQKYESEYEKLLRNIHQKPSQRRPALGTVPEWLDEDMVTLSNLKNIRSQIKNSPMTNLFHRDILSKKYTQEFIQSVKSSEFKNEDDISYQSIVKKIDEFKLYRDEFVEFLELLIIHEVSQVDIITRFFEDMYNSLLVLPEGKHSYYDRDFDHLYFFIWELFICTIALLFHFEKFADINAVLTHTYFLRKSSIERETNLDARNYVAFRRYLSSIEEEYKPNCSEPRLYTLTGKILIDREKKPILTKQVLAQTDVLLYQLSEVLNIKDEYGSAWFPTSYIYADSFQTQWIKLKSKKYCSKIFPLFGVGDIENLKLKITSAFGDARDIRYTGAFQCVSTIQSSIQIDEIATLM